MKNNFSKILVAILTMVTLLCILAIGANAAAGDAVSNGVTDTGFAWALTEAEESGYYVLTITDTDASKELTSFSYTVNGEGPDKKVFPWGLDNHRKVVEIVYKANASALGDYVFWDAWALRKVTLPNTVTTLGYQVFRDSISLATIAVEGEALGDNTLNFRYITQILPETDYTKQFVNCFSTDIDYKVYLSNNFYIPATGKIYGFATTNDEWVNLNSGQVLAKTSRFDAGDIFYIPEGFPNSYRLGLLRDGLGFTIASYPKAEVTESSMEMYGYQVRTSGYNGLRGIFNFNENAVNEGFTLIEYGAILAADANRGTDDANIKLSYNNETGAYEPAGEKIVKFAIKENGAFASGVKVLDTLNGKAVEEIKGENYTWFATTVINFNANYKDDVYMCGYEIWKNILSDEINIVYTGYANAEHESKSIYDVSVKMLEDGVTNDLVNNPIGSVVKAAGAVTLTASNATLPAGVTTLVAENIEMMGYSDKDGFTAGTTYYTLYEGSNGNYLAYISGEGNLSAAALKTNYANSYSGDSRPVPTLLASAHDKITHMVVGEGIVDISSFASMTKLQVIIYPTSLKTISGENTYSVFQYCNSLSKIVPVGMVTSDKIFELSGIGGFDNANYMWSFQDCKAVEYIHLKSFRSGSQIFHTCTSLKAVWVGDVERPADGVADFRKSGASSIKLDFFTYDSNITTLLLSDTFTSVTAASGISINTIYQATENPDIKSTCEGMNPVITYTQALPQ